MSTDIQHEPSSNDFKLIEEAIRRMKRSRPDAPWTKEALRTTLTNELRRGRRDLFSLIRAARRALDGPDDD